MSTKDWNPNLYLKFGRERIQPSIDLASRIDMEDPVNIIDMISKAKQDYPNQQWQLLDAGKDTIPGKYDIVFSNATIQWIPNHSDLFKRFKGILTDKGIIAVQIPLFFNMPLGKSIAEISKNKRWSELTESVNELFTIHTPSHYYDILSGLFGFIEIWESDYIHVMDLCEAHYLALEMLNRDKRSGAFNLGSGSGYSVKDVIEKAVKITGKDIRTVITERRPGDPSRLVADYALAKRTFGWEPKRPLEEMIRSAWDFMKKDSESHN